jgi:hypothetical protein
MLSSVSTPAEQELYFLVAKMLRLRFPDVADIFIRRCEAEGLFLASVF